MFTESDDMFAADFDVSLFCFSAGLRLNQFSVGSFWETWLLCLSFPQSARLRAAGIGKDFKENPNLRDNWTDAEGYYRKPYLSL